jgi:hypothetical protein
MGAHLAACTTVPYPVRRHSAALGPLRPFGTASASVRIKKQVKKKIENKKEKERWGYTWQPVPQFPTPFVTVHWRWAVRDGVGTCKIQKVS